MMSFTASRLWAGGQDPVHLGAISDDGVTALAGATDVRVIGPLAYVSAFLDNGVEILDISDPTNPTHVGAIFDTGVTELAGAHDIVVIGGFAYVSGFNDDGFEILDVSDPANPTHVGAITDNGTTELDGAAGVAVRHNFAYIAATFDDGVEILDVSDPANPTHVGSITDDGTTALDGAHDIALLGNFAFVAASVDDGIEILDISDPANPTHVAAIFDDGVTELDGVEALTISLPGPGSGSGGGEFPDGEFPCADFLMIFSTAYEDDGVQSIDLSDPTNPVPRAFVSDSPSTVLDGAISVSVLARDLPDIIVTVGANAEDGIQVIDFTDCDNPIPIGSITDSGPTELDGVHNCTTANVFDPQTGTFIKHIGVCAAFDDNGVEIMELPGPPLGPACIEPDRGDGTITFPPASCGYAGFMRIVDGLPAGSTIDIDIWLDHYSCVESDCESPGGGLGGAIHDFDADLCMNLKGTGDLSTFGRWFCITADVTWESSLRTPGDSVQNFQTGITSLSASLSAGDPDFAVLDIEIGQGLGLGVSPGVTTLVEQPSGDFAVDTWFDIDYQVIWTGAAGGALDGLSGTTEGYSKLVATSGLVFADGFESGDTSAWSNTVP